MNQLINSYCSFQMSKANPFENWEVSSGKDSHIYSKTKQELHNIYYKKKNKQSQLEQIISYNTNFEEFRLQGEDELAGGKEGGARQRDDKFFFEDKSLLDEDKKSFKTLKNSQTYVLSFVHSILLLILLLNHDILLLMIIGSLLHCAAFTMMFFHHRPSSKIYTKITRSTFILSQIIVMMTANLFSMKSTLSNLILIMIFLICVIPECKIWKEMISIYQAQKLIDVKIEEEEQEQEEEEDDVEVEVEGESEEFNID